MSRSRGNGARTRGINTLRIQHGNHPAVPEETRVLAAEVEDDIATVDLSSDFDDGGGTFSMRARLAQLVDTVTAYDPAITGARLRLDGSPIEVFSSEGLVLDDPMTRQSFLDLARGS
ncbi:MAG: GerMN domain-containing protein [Actinomycetota bacterium]